MHDKAVMGWRLACTWDTHRAAVVDEASQVPALGGVYDCVMVDSEQVAAADALLSIPFLPVISHHLQIWSWGQYTSRQRTVLRKH